MPEVWRRGEGYTSEQPAVPTIVIDARDGPPRALPAGSGSGPPRPRVRRPAGRGRPETVLIWLVVGVALSVVTLLAYWLGRVDGEGTRLDQERVERWEDRLDTLDATAVSLFDPNLSATEEQALGLRLEHLQRSWCADVEPVVEDVPNHLRQAYGQVCEGG